MASDNLMIDYEEHPGFNSSGSRWPYDSELLNRFNYLYEELKSGQILVDPEELLELHDLTFSLFRVKSNDYLADAFVSELHEKVAHEIKLHIKYFYL